MLVLKHFCVMYVSLRAAEMYYNNINERRKSLSRNLELKIYNHRLWEWKEKKTNTLVQANCCLLYSIYVITIHLLPFSNLCFFQRSKNCSGFSWKLIKHIFRISPFVADAKAFHFDAKCGLPAAGVRRWGWQQRIAQAWSASEPAAAAGPTGKGGSSGGSVQKGTAGEACGQQPRVGGMVLAFLE